MRRNHLKELFLSGLFFFCALVAAQSAEIVPPTAVRLPPVFWYESDPEAHRKFSMALLLYWNGEDPSGRFRLLAPFFYSSKTAKEHFRILLPFHFKYSDENSDMKLWGLYFSRTSQADKMRVLFPFYFHTESPGNQLTFMTLYLRQSNPAYDAKILFPLYWKLNQHGAVERNWETLVPFYFKMNWEKDTKKLLISPLYWSYREPGMSQGMVPPYYWRHTPDSKFGVGFPLYWRFYKSTGTETRDVEVAVPYFRYQKNQTTYRGFVPLYFGRTKVFENATSTSPAKISRWNLILPLAFTSERPDGNRKIVTPLFSRFEDEEGKVYGHAGLNFYSHDVWGGKTEVLFPFLYSRTEPDSYRFRWLNFSGGADKKREHIRASVFPVFGYRRDADRTQILTPFFYRDRDPDLSRGFLLPYFWRTDTAAGQTTLIKRYLVPVFWHYRSEEYKTTVVPPLALFFDREDYKVSMIAPFFFHRKKGEDALTITPAFIARRSPDKNWTGFFYLYWLSDKKDRRSWTVFPLFRKSEFPGGKSILFPGFYYLKDTEGAQGVAGIYFWDHRGETRYDFLPPVWWKFKRPTWNVNMVFPWYRFKNESIDEKGIFPLWAKTAGVETSSGLPKHFLADSHRLLPFYFYRKLDHGYDLILPIFLGRRLKTLDEQGKPYEQRRYLLSGYWEKSAGRFVHRFDPLFAYNNTPGRKGFVSPTAPFPLWRHEVFNPNSPQEKIVRGAVFPYYWRRSLPFDWDWVFPIFYSNVRRTSGGDRVLSKHTWLVLYYASEDRDMAKKKRFVLPLYWYVKNPELERTVFALVWSERGADFDRKIFFPLWWSFRNGPERTSVLFPILFRSTDEKTGASSLILPGFWKKKGPEGSALLIGPYFRKETSLREKTTVLFPIYWSVSAPDHSARTVFPLFWQWKNPERSVTHFFPLYLHHKREDLDWMVAFPLYWQFKTADSVTRVVPPYFSVTSKDKKKKVSGFAPLWTVSRDEAEDSRSFQFLGGLFGYERTGDQKTFTFLYLIRTNSKK